MNPLPVSVTLATRDERTQIAPWLCDRTIYEDAFMLAAPPDPAWVRESMLLVKSNLRLEFQEVRFWSIRMLAAPAQAEPSALLGFAIDYGWNRADDSEREVDFAMPHARGKNPRLAFYALALVIHQLFTAAGATAVWGRIPLRATRQGLPRLFAALGAATMDVSYTLQPTTKQHLPRIAYRNTPETFYASTIGRRLHNGGMAL